MFTGSDLLNKVKGLGDISKSDLVRACGYVSTKKDGGERLNFTAFMKHCWRPKASVLAWVELAVWAKAAANSAM